jgi:hypothetical protein
MAIFMDARRKSGKSRAEYLKKKAPDMLRCLSKIKICRRGQYLPLTLMVAVVPEPVIDAICTTL